MTEQIGVLCGGWSSEREVSLRSGQNVFNSLKRLGKNVVMIDPKFAKLSDYESLTQAFIALHGEYGEDGRIQGFLDVLGIPYPGSGVAASAIGMNKIMTKERLLSLGLPTAKFARIPTHNALMQLDFPYPYFIKPVSGGSSLGAAIVTNNTIRDQIPAEWFQNYGAYLAEAYVKGREVTSSVIEQNGELIVLPILELRPKNEFYDYEAKYTPGMTEFILPAELSSETEQQIQTLTKAAFEGVGCRGFARVDFLIGSEGPMILEINTVPGFTDTSDLPAQALKFGLSFDELMSILIANIPSRR